MNYVWLTKLTIGEVAHKTGKSVEELEKLLHLGEERELHAVKVPMPSSRSWDWFTLPRS